MTERRMDHSPALETWLQKATCRLSAASAARVRTEIEAHYESAREEVLAGGTTAEEADRAAVRSLGDAKVANRQYRKILVTRDEARMLGQAKWEARLVCSRSWLRWLLRAIPVAMLCAGAGLLARNPNREAWLFLLLTTGMGLLLAMFTLPIYTPARGRIFRYVKWAWLIAIMALVSWQDFPKNLWLFAPCAWFLAWIEGMHISLRRKLPVAEWPKQLYL
jgi:hypothetical protein